MVFTELDMMLLNKKFTDRELRRFNFSPGYSQQLVPYFIKHLKSNGLNDSTIFHHIITQTCWTDQFLIDLLNTYSEVMDSFDQSIWELLSGEKSQLMVEKLIEIGKLSVKDVCYNHNISEDLMIEIVTGEDNSLSRPYLFSNKGMTEKFYQRLIDLGYLKYFYWPHLIYHPGVSYQFIEKYFPQSEQTDYYREIMALRPDYPKDKLKQLMMEKMFPNEYHIRCLYRYPLIEQLLLEDEEIALRYHDYLARSMAHHSSWASLNFLEKVLFDPGVPSLLKDVFSPGTLVWHHILNLSDQWLIVKIIESPYYCQFLNWQSIADNSNLSQQFWERVLDPKGDLYRYHSQVPVWNLNHLCIFDEEFYERYIFTNERFQRAEIFRDYWYRWHFKGSIVSEQFVKEHIARFSKKAKSRILFNYYLYNQPKAYLQQYQRSLEKLLGTYGNNRIANTLQYLR